MKIIKNFAVFEGIDGSGTTTQLSLLERRLAAERAGSPVMRPAFEPTDGPIGALIRSALKREIRLCPGALARLFAADRCEHLYGPGGILERCQRGELVVSDRYSLSSLVYQGIDCGDELPKTLNDPFPAPELLIFFDIAPEAALARLKSRPSLEIYEYLEFQQQAREKYHALLGEYREPVRRAGGRLEIIDASQSPEAVAGEVWSAVL